MSRTFLTSRFPLTGRVEFGKIGEPMLTRLQVSGFKNLVDVDVRFGPFTCISANGTGKSNLFDAIQFLSRLASDTFVDAAASIRAEDEKATSVQNLFHRIGSEYADSISFTAK